MSSRGEKVVDMAPSQRFLAKEETYRRSQPPTWESRKAFLVQVAVTLTAEKALREYRENIM